ncbi:hypothetical protein LMJF_11_1070 [Leishmania major strain Friedlin]|uniref:Uncharacterized protein n=1 Tax=Leishmania major TaxID=5664 RepID=Q4QGX3_LEIMA|nr:hypothetical protein LMJF_11_1070 [Leishmania major strain Friedlin]CAG9570277.1 hypothetical_protein [Leishmania major strain Friedlin]CAJ02936.1 hypothetical protein LMJF_11_1070 [Leishmania major strain Friedlin]|eukprot:XP_001681575.1 hypothetical protein LMJF_11_1070 [Leishmania major strain Friedlin]
MSVSVTEHRHGDMHHGTMRRRCLTRVLLAGPQGDLEALVSRMPRTWSLQQPLEMLQPEAVEEERANTASAAAATRTENAGLAGGKVPDKSAASVMISYSPVRATLPLAAAASEEERAEEDVVDVVAAVEEKAAMKADLHNSSGSAVEPPSLEGTPNVRLHAAQAPHEEQQEEGDCGVVVAHEAPALTEDGIPGADSAVVRAAEVAATLDIGSQLAEAAPCADRASLDSSAALPVSQVPE